MVSQRERIEIIEQIQAVDDAIIFFERSPCLVLSGVAMQLADDQMLCGGLQRQRDHQPLNIVPFGDDVVRSQFANGSDEPGFIVIGRGLEALQPALHLGVKIFVAWGKLVAKKMQQCEVEPIDPMNIGGVNPRLDSGAVVEQDVEDKMTFMFVSANDTGIDRGRDWQPMCKQQCPS